MAININGIQFSSVRGDNSVDRPAAAKPGATPSGGSPGKPVNEIDPVRLTPSSQALRQMETDREQPIDETRVTALRKAIEEGSYSINAQRIAEKMSTFESTLFG